MDMQCMHIRGVAGACSPHARGAVCSPFFMQSMLGRLFRGLYQADAIRGPLGVLFYTKLVFRLYKRGIDGLRVGVVAEND